ETVRRRHLFDLLSGHVGHANLRGLTSRIDRDARALLHQSVDCLRRIGAAVVEHEPWTIAGDTSVQPGYLRQLLETYGLGERLLDQPVLDSQQHPERPRGHVVRGLRRCVWTAS